MAPPTEKKMVSKTTLAHLCRNFTRNTKTNQVRQCGCTLYTDGPSSESVPRSRCSLSGRNSCMGKPETSPYHTKYPHLSCSMIFCNFCPSFGCVVTLLFRIAASVKRQKLLPIHCYSTDRALRLVKDGY